MKLHKWVLAGAITGSAAALMYYTAPLSGTLVVLSTIALLILWPGLSGLSILLSLAFVYGLYCLTMLVGIIFVQRRSGARMLSG